MTMRRCMTRHWYPRHLYPRRGETDRESIPEKLTHANTHTRHTYTHTHTKREREGEREREKEKERERRRRSERGGEEGDHNGNNLGGLG